MRWLVHGNITAAAIEALRRHEQEPRQAQDVGLSANASPNEVLDAARKAQLEIVTADAALAQAPFEQPSRFARTMVFLNVEGGDIEQDDAIDRLFARYKRMSPGRLYTVTASQVKVRQLPGAR